MNDLTIDLFAGPGGWSEGIRLLGLRDIGLEWDTAACKTRKAAGHLTIQCDVTQYPTEPFRGRLKGKIGSPTCTPWSRAGKGLGLVDQPFVHQAVADLSRGRDTRAALLAACKDKNSLLAAEPMRWLNDLRPEWVAMEQVPDVLPLWKQYAEILRSWGYSVWTGILNAADYGVPQTRTRAILAASRVRTVTAPPATHTQHPMGEDLFGHSRPGWVSMADALGLAPGLRVNTRGNRRTAGGNEFEADGPSWALTEKTRSWVLRNGTQKNACFRRLDEPAGTLFFAARCNDVSWVSEDSESIRITVPEAAILQSFHADYPWQGSKTKQFEQIGNAVPPLLAAHVVAAATGIAVSAGAAEVAA